MTINPQEVINYIETQKKTFEDIIIERDRDDFYKGVLEGMSLVRNYVNMLVDVQDKGMSEHEKK